MVGIEDHLVDGVDRKAVVGGVARAGGEVDGAADVVAVALDGGSVVHADANGRRSVPAQDVME